MLFSPAAVETEIAIAERAGKRDLSHVRRGREPWRRRLERLERAVDLPCLTIHPGLHTLVLWTISALVNEQHTGIEDTVAQRLQTQRRKARRSVGGNDFAAAGEMIEILEDHTGIVKRRAVVEN